MASCPTLLPFLNKTRMAVPSKLKKIPSTANQVYDVII